MTELSYPHLEIPLYLVTDTPPTSHPPSCFVIWSAPVSGMIYKAKSKEFISWLHLAVY